MKRCIDTIGVALGIAVIAVAPARAGDDERSCPRAAARLDGIVTVEAESAPPPADPLTRDWSIPTRYPLRFDWICPAPPSVLLDAPPAPEVAARGLGVIASPDGLVVTSAALTDRGDRLFVRLADGRRARADLLATDVAAGTALLRIDAGRGLPAMRLRDASSLERGAALRLVATPCAARSAWTADATFCGASSRGEMLFAWIDEVVAGGAEGGVLLDAEGAVVGVGVESVRASAPFVSFPLGGLACGVSTERVRELIATAGSTSGARSAED